MSATQSHPPLSDLPRYRSHKIVQAARITGVSEGALGGVEAKHDAVMRWHLEGGFVVNVDAELAGRIPKGIFSPVSGYFVQYEDGFRSWSPANAFEAGYHPLTIEEEAGFRNPLPPGPTHPESHPNPPKEV